MEQNEDFIKDWLEGKVSPEELKRRKAEGDESVQQFGELVARTSRMKAPGKLTKEEAWQKLSAKLTETPKEEVKEAKVVRMNRWIPISIAASISVIVIAFFFFRDTTVQTFMAETKVYVLPDGSEVTLNADSKIAFSKRGWDDDRTVRLEGEAFFQVKKGSTFTVATESGTVTVLGTSFNVNTRPGTFQVSCYTGKVQVSSSGQRVVLTKGLFTRLKAGNLIDATSFDEKQGTWRNGEFYFDGEPLSAVIAELERQFKVDIEYNGDTSRLYTGYFSSQHLDEAMDMVFKPMSLQYKKENDKIIVQ
jgi:ferric-dicitrate binding protein FerR (iron transport regulator)